MRFLALELRIVVADSRVVPLRQGQPLEVDPEFVSPNLQSRIAEGEAQQDFEQRLMAVLAALAVAPRWFVVGIGPCSIL